MESELEINLFIAQNITCLHNAQLVEAEKGHGHNIDIIKSISGLKSKDKFPVVAFTYSAENFAIEEYLDVIMPIPDESESKEYIEHIKSEREDLLTYNKIPAICYSICPSYSTSLDDIGLAEIKVIEKIGYSNYARVLEKTSNTPLIATAKERSEACVKAWKENAI